MKKVNLVEYAHGKDCQIWLDGCEGIRAGNHLAHWRSSSTGVGQKEDDLLGSHSCKNCHDLVDNRKYNSALELREVRLAHACGVMRTISLLRSEDII